MRGRADTKQDIGMMKIKNNIQMYKKIYHDRVEWRNSEDKLHRINGPAIIWNTGRREWLRDGELHRLNGPAIEENDGHQEWYRFGKLDCEFGSAIRYADGSEDYYLYGVHLTTKQWQTRVIRNKIVSSKKKPEKIIAIINNKKFSLVPVKNDTVTINGTVYLLIEGDK